MSQTKRKYNNTDDDSNQSVSLSSISNATKKNKKNKPTMISPDAKRNKNDLETMNDMNEKEENVSSQHSNVLFFYCANFIYDMKQHLIGKHIGSNKTKLICKEKSNDASKTSTTNKPVPNNKLQTNIETENEDSVETEDPTYQNNSDGASK